MANLTRDWWRLSKASDWRTVLVNKDNHPVTDDAIMTK